MKKNIYRKIAAVVAVVFSLLIIVEGSLVLLGITQHEYIVFTPLLIYNILMGLVGLIAGIMLWLNRKKAFMLTKLIVAAHLIVLLIVGVMYFSSNAVALHSLQAMGIRVVIWLIITLVAWKTIYSNEKN
ncbi:MAG: hypothetical protein IT276_01040 [Ignavibacteriaceae bacterium]|nr:hypothetical protein [Ignavibacterium sp.]MCC6253480.1 hypothetical protein [Ignavibacteriaceae bacterium]HRP91926.1 hypothetical protein [Ignavibacteriaceae bacterium]HRQ54806.1 hypothetical protein [Ignavibacteriaceae bacterium]